MPTQISGVITVTDKNKQDDTDTLDTMYPVCSEYNQRNYDLKDLTSECRYIGNKPHRRHVDTLSSPEFIVVHIFGPRLHDWRIPIDTGVALAYACSHHPELQHSLGRAAYNFNIFGDGRTDQLVPVNYYTPHALKYSRYSISIAVVGTHSDIDSMPTAQLHSLIALLRVLQDEYPDAQIRGHDELTGHGNYSNDMTKICPKLDMDAIRDIVKDIDTVDGLYFRYEYKDI